MSHLTITAQFDAPIERVFALGIDFTRYPEWNVTYPEIKEVVGAPDKVGTRIHATTRFLGRSMDSWGEIVGIDPPRLLRMSGSSAEGGRLDLAYRLTPKGTGTELVIEADYELPAGIFGKLADKLFIERAVERDLRHSLDNFGAFLALREPTPV
jgi:uncharacterized protein YndB with AHSA1/START domain